MCGAGGIKGKCTARRSGVCGKVRARGGEVGARAAAGPQRVRAQACAVAASKEGHRPRLTKACARVARSTAKATMETGKV